MSLVDLARLALESAPDEEELDAAIRANFGEGPRALNLRPLESGPDDHQDAGAYRSICGTILRAMEPWPSSRAASIAKATQALVASREDTARLLALGPLRIAERPDLLAMSEAFFEAMGRSGPAFEAVRAAVRAALVREYGVKPNAS